MNTVVKHVLESKSTSFGFYVKSEKLITVERFDRSAQRTVEVSTMTLKQAQTLYRELRTIGYYPVTSKVEPVVVTAKEMLSNLKAAKAA